MEPISITREGREAGRGRLYACHRRFFRSPRRASRCHTITGIILPVNCRGSFTRISPPTVLLNDPFPGRAGLCLYKVYIFRITASIGWITLGEGGRSYDTGDRIYSVMICNTIYARARARDISRYRSNKNSQRVRQ